MLDLIRFAVALLPIACYAAVMGFLASRKAPSIRNSATDFLLLALGMLGIVCIGPIELFFPRAASTLLGQWVWVVLIALYLFIALLIALNLPLRLLITGISHEETKRAIETCLRENEIQHQWDQTVLWIPAMGIRASLEELRGSQLIQLSSIGSKQNPTEWFNLQRLLADCLSKQFVTQPTYAFRWLGLSAILFALALMLLLFDMPRLSESMVTLFGS
jgi:hypothetical protein